MDYKHEKMNTLMCAHTLDDVEYEEVETDAAAYDDDVRNENDTTEHLVVFDVRVGDEEEEEDTGSPHEHNIDERTVPMEVLCERTPRMFGSHEGLEADEEDTHDTTGQEVGEQHAAECPYMAVVVSRPTQLGDKEWQDCATREKVVN